MCFGDRKTPSTHHLASPTGSQVKGVDTLPIYPLPEVREDLPDSRPRVLAPLGYGSRNSRHVKDPSKTFKPKSSPSLGPEFGARVSPPSSLRTLEDESSLVRTSFFVSGDTSPSGPSRGAEGDRPAEKRENLCFKAQRPSPTLLPVHKGRPCHPSGTLGVPTGRDTRQGAVGSKTSRPQVLRNQSLRCWSSQESTSQRISYSDFVLLTNSSPQAPTTLILAR